MRRSQTATLSAKWSAFSKTPLTQHHSSRTAGEASVKNQSCEKTPHEHPLINTRLQPGVCPSNQHLQLFQQFPKWLATTRPVPTQPALHPLLARTIQSPFGVRRQSASGDGALPSPARNSGTHQRSSSHRAQPKLRQVLDCASPLALWILVPSGPWSLEFGAWIFLVPFSYSSIRHFSRLILHHRHMPYIPHIPSHRPVQPRRIHRRENKRTIKWLAPGNGHPRHFQSHHRPNTQYISDRQNEDHNQASRHPCAPSGIPHLFAHTVPNAIFSQKIRCFGLWSFSGAWILELGVFPILFSCPHLFASFCRLIFLSPSFCLSAFVSIGVHWWFNSPLNPNQGISRHIKSPKGTNFPNA